MDGRRTAAGIRICANSMAVGHMTRGEWLTFIVFIMAASLWIFRTPRQRQKKFFD